MSALNFASLSKLWPGFAELGVACTRTSSLAPFVRTAPVADGRSTYKLRDALLLRDCCQAVLPGILGLPALYKFLSERRPVERDFLSDAFVHERNF